LTFGGFLSEDGGKERVRNSRVDASLESDARRGREKGRDRVSTRKEGRERKEEESKRTFEQDPGQPYQSRDDTPPRVSG